MGRSTALRLRALALCALAGCAPEADPLVVFAAASASGAAEDLARDAERSVGPVVVSMGATSTLARQIDAGAPVDVLLTVGDEWPAWLESRGKVSGPLAEIARGRLALVVAPQAGPASGLHALASMDRLALADPAHVPAGRFARTALERADLWREVEPRVVPFPDVRAALAAVASGRADAALVYRTDAHASDRVRVGLVLPASSHPPIVYRCAVVTGSGREADARRFCRLAQTRADVWERLGFGASGAAPGR